MIGGGIAPPAPHGVLYVSREGDVEAAGAAVAGLPVAVRSVMAAVRAGCSTVILPSSLRSHDIARAIDRRPAARAAVRWLDQGRLPPGPGRVLLIPATVVVTRASLKALLAERGAVVLAGSPPEAPVAVIDSDQIDTAGDALACGQPSAVALRAAREARPVTGAQGSWCVQARDAAGRQEAQRRLFASLGAPVDSWFDRTVHRRASAPLTRLAVALGVSPNAVSLASLALQQNDLVQAQTHVETILADLEVHPQAGMDEPFGLYLTCYRVLNAAQDGRAKAVLQRAGLTR